MLEAGRPRSLTMSIGKARSPKVQGTSPARDGAGLSAKEILLKYWPQISFRVKNTIGRSTPDWEDVGSEILLGVVEAIRKGTFRGESALPTFIYSITTHKIVDYIRQKKRTLEPVPEPRQGLDPSLQAENQERVKLVAGLLKNLKPRHADILYLHYYLEMSREEIGRIHGISPGRVGVLIAAARKMLKDLIKKLGAPLPGGASPL
jgi:RNA polymerase sigma-70 factor (ECF subfamily)